MLELLVIMIVFVLVATLALVIGVSFWASYQAADHLKESHTKATGHTQFKEEFQFFHYPMSYGPTDPGQADFAVVIWRCAECNEIVAPPNRPAD